MCTNQVRGFIVIIAPLQRREPGKQVLFLGYRKQLVTLLFGHSAEPRGFWGAPTHSSPFQPCILPPACQQHLSLPPPPAPRGRLQLRQQKPGYQEKIPRKPCRKAPPAELPSKKPLFFHGRQAKQPRFGCEHCGRAGESAGRERQTTPGRGQSRGIMGGQNSLGVKIVSLGKGWRASTGKGVARERWVSSSGWVKLGKRRGAGDG